MLTHESRQLPSWLIFDVSQKMKPTPLRKQVKLFARIRRERIAALLARGLIRRAEEVPVGAIPANVDLQASANTYCPKIFYLDRPFRCVGCGKQEIWTAEDQMYWHETMKGTIHTIPKRCRVCRKIAREKKAKHRERSVAGAAKKRANKAPEPTPTAGTSAAEQPLVPAAVVAHL